MNQQEVRVKFTASAKDIEEVYKKIKEISSADNIKIDEALTRQLKALETKVPGLVDRIKSAMNMKDLSAVDVQALDKEFQQVSKILDKTIEQLSSKNLPAALQKQIENAKKEVEKAKSDLDKTNKNITSKSNKLDKSTATGLSKKEAQSIAKQGGMTDLTLQTKNQGTLSFGTDLNAYIAKFNELRNASQLAYGEVSKGKEIISKLQPAYQSAANGIQKEVDALNQEKIAKEQAVVNAQQHVVDLQKQITASDQYSEQEKQTAQEIVNAQNQLQQAKTNEAKAVDSAKENLKTDTKVTQQNTNAKVENTSTVAKAAKQVFSYGTVLMLFRRVYSTVVNTIKEMDKALTGMAVVTNMSREETWKLVDSFSNLAKETGKTTSEIANMATKFYQQGKSTTQVLQLTEAAAKAATIAGIDGSQSIDLLTNAMNGFQMSASQAMEVSDKFAALAASAATDYEELATALSKVAAQANLAGMSMDFTLGLLTKGIEVTREAPETIGTALKTVIARMRELTDYGATLEDGIDVNRVAKALDNIGVSLMDTNGQFRDLELVLTEVGKKWDTLNVNQQANVAVALAGTRQQSRLIAMMQDFDRTLELVDISANSYGATLAQSEKYMGGLEAAQAGLTTSAQNLITTLTKSDTIIGIVDILAGALDVITWIVDQQWLMIPLLILIGGHAANALNLKIQEANYAKQVRITELQTLKDKKLLRKEQIKIRLSTLQTYAAALKQSEATEDTLENVLNIAKTKAKEAGNTALAAKYEAEINALNADDAKEKITQLSVEQEIKTLKAEEALLDAQIASTSAQITTQTNAAGGAIGFLVNGVTRLFSILTLIPGVLQLIIGLQKKSTTESKKQTEEEKKGFIAKLQSAGAKMAESAANMGPVGLVIAAAILAAVGMAIAIGIAAANANSGKTRDDSIAKTKEELNQLQAELYNMNSAKENVTKLADEFDNLSNKIIKSNEELERMKEIAQQINDEAGREVVNLTADAETQARQIRAYNMTQEAEIKAQQNKINKELGQGLHDVQHANDGWQTAIGITGYLLGPIGWLAAGVANAALESADRDEENVKKYYDSLKNDEAFVNSLRTIGKAQLSGLDTASAATSDAILDMMVGNIDSGAYFDENGLNTAAYEKYVNEALAGTGIGGYSGLVQELDAVAEDGSLSAYANMLDKLGTAQKGSPLEGLVNSLKESNGMFAAVAKMGSKTARVFDSIGFSSEELNTMWQSLEKSVGALGGDTAEAFANIANAMSEDNTELENRQIAYKELVKQQLAAKDSAQAILDGTDKNSEAAKKYLAAQETLVAKQNEMLELQKKIDEAEEKGKDKKVEKYTKQLDKVASDAAVAEEAVNAVEDAANNAEVNINELRAVLGIVDAQKITEEMTKLASTMERFSKVTDLASLSLSEQMELLTDYPELLAAMERGYITAAEAAAQYGETIAQSQEDIAANKSNYKLLYSKEGGLKLTTSDMIGFENLFDNSEAGKAARKKFLEMGTLSEDDDWVKAMLKEYETYGFASKKEMLDYLNGVKADVEDFNKQDYLDEQLSEGNYTAIMSSEAKEQWVTANDLVAQHRNQLEKINTELEQIDQNSAEYNNKLKERNSLLLQTITDGENKLKEIQNKTDEVLKVNPADSKYGFLSQYTGGDNSLSEYVKYVNGVAEINYEALSNVSEEHKNTFLAYISTVIETLNNFAEEEQEITESIREDQETLAQSFIDNQVKILEAQIEALEKRKEAYEKYFEEIDALAEEEERAATMQDLAKQISALSGGHDAATNSLRKDLMSQMEDLRKEEEEARREAAREAVIQDIDDQVEQLNTQLEKVNESLNMIVALIANSSDNIAVEIGTDGNMIFKKDGKAWSPYAEGGLVDYTGPAIVHGSPSSPEAFLSAQDTKNMQLLFAALNSVMSQSSIITQNSDINNNSNSVTVENINITTTELNNDQDFRNAGQLFAEEFNKAIKQRGLNINVKK